jgi:hypothetical protein
VHVAWIERLDQPLESATLPRGVPALEHDRERRSEPALVARQLAAERQPQLREPSVRSLESLGVLLLRERQRQIELV